MSTVAHRPFHSAVSPSVADTAALIGRILLAVIFVKSGWGFGPGRLSFRTHGRPVSGTAFG